MSLTSDFVNDELDNTFASVQPCGGTRYHDLKCGHRIRTGEIESCGSNCVNTGPCPEFVCISHLDHGIRKFYEDYQRAGALPSLPENRVDVEQEVHTETLREMQRLADHGFRVRGPVMKLDPIDQFFQDNLMDEQRQVAHRYRGTPMRIEELELPFKNFMSLEPTPVNDVMSHGNDPWVAGLQDQATAFWNQDMGVQEPEISHRYPISPDMPKDVGAGEFPDDFDIQVSACLDEYWRIQEDLEAEALTAIIRRLIIAE